MVKNETLRHKEAFEYYYALGTKRSYPLVSSKFTVSLTSVKNWSKSFNWQERVKFRDMENGKKLEEITNQMIVEAESEYLKLIRASLNEYVLLLKQNQIKMGVKDLKMLYDLEMQIRNDNSSEEQIVNIIFKRVSKPLKFEDIN